MGLHNVSAAFNAIDNMSNIAGNIGNSLAGMADKALNSMQSVDQGFNLGTAALTGLATVGVGAIITAVGIGIDQMEQMNKAMAGISARTGAASEDLQAMRHSAEDLFNSGLVDNFDQAAKAVEGIYTQVKGLNMSGDGLTKYAEKVSGIAKAWDTTEKNVTTGVKNLQDKFPEVTKVIEPMSGAIDKATANTGHWATTTGMSAGEVDKLQGKINLAKAQLADYNDRMAKGHAPTHVQALHIQDLTGKLSAWETQLKNGTGTHKVWVSDVQQSSQKVSTSLLDPQKALDLLTATAQDSHLPLDQINQIVGSYGSKFAAAGISAMGMGGMIVLGAQAGITNFGALGTALDKLHDNIAKPRPAFVQAMRNLGLADVLQQAQQNKIPMEQVADEIFKKFENMDDGPTKTAAALALFGPGIDKIGGAEALGKLAGFRDALGGDKGIQGAAQKVTDTIKEDGTLGTAIRIFGNNAKTWVGDAAQSVFDKSKEIYNTLKNADWSGAIHTVFDPIITFWNSLWGDDGSIAKLLKDTWNGIVKWLNGSVGAVRSAFGAIADAINGALGPVLSTINSIVAGINTIMGFHGGPVKLHQAGPGESGIGMIPGQALGGDIPHGWSWVGEQGPELVFNNGSSAHVYSNQQSRSILGNGGGSSGGNTYITVSAGTVVGSSGMDEFTRMMYKRFQEEDQRRGLTS